MKPPVRELLRLRNAGFRHRGAPEPVLEGVDLSVREGDRILIRGPSGSGKSTLLQILAGLAPEYVSGALTGTVERLYDSMGVVLQNPEAQVVTPTVEEEVAFSLENDGVEVPEIRRRISGVLDRLGIGGLSERHPLSLSGGECQRVSLAAALAREPDILFLDEPTAYLDRASASSFFEALSKLPARTAVVVVEHRIETAASVCSRAWEVTPRGGLIPSDFRTSPPLSAPPRPSGEAVGPVPPPALEVRGLSHRYGTGAPVLRDVDLVVPAGRVAGLTGPSGCGKTTLLGRIARILPPGPGSIRIAGQDAPARKPAAFHASLMYIPQNPEHLFVAERVREELGLSGDPALELAERFGLAGRLDSNPYRLSEGEKRRLNLCVALAERRPLCLLDEPTYGLDDSARDILVRDIRTLASSGTGVLMVSHDEEFLAAASDVVLRMKDGGIPREEALRAGSLKSA